MDVILWLKIWSGDICFWSCVALLLFLFLSSKKYPGPGSYSKFWVVAVVMVVSLAVAAISFFFGDGSYVWPLLILATYSGISHLTIKSSMLQAEKK